MASKKSNRQSTQNPPTSAKKQKPDSPIKSTDKISSKKKSTTSDKISSKKKSVTSSVPSTAIKEKASSNGSNTAIMERKLKEKTAPVSEVKRSAPIVARIAKTLGSLQLAVILLSVFAFVVAVGTVMENKFGTQIAQDLVYQAWWFNFLLLMLSVNIFFAAAKKAQPPQGSLVIPPVTENNLLGQIRGRSQQVWAVMCHYWPWKRHQFGFIVTHIGLITLLAGGIVNGIWGVDAQMLLVASGDPDVQNQVRKEYGYVPHSSSEAVYSNVSQISVRIRPQVPPGESLPEGELFTQDFSPGPLPWKKNRLEEEFKTDVATGFIYAMNILHSPFGRSWGMFLPNGSRLEALDHIPLAQREDFDRAPEGVEGRPAFKVQLQSARIGRPFNFWLSNDRQSVKDFPKAKNTISYRIDQLRFTRLEIIGKCHNKTVLKEFLNPPPAEELGKNGVLGVLSSGIVHRVSLDELGEKKQRIGSTPFFIQFDSVLPAVPDLEKDLPILPAVSFKFWDQDGRLHNLKVFSRMVGSVLTAAGTNFPEGVMGFPSFLYHAPDVRNNDAELDRVLQFVNGPTGDLHYRLFEMVDGSMKCTHSSQVSERRRWEEPIWGSMQWKFRVAKILPNAVQKVWYSPVDIPPGKAKPMDERFFPSVAHFRLSPSRGEAKEFYVQRGQARTIAVGNKLYTVEYGYKIKPLDFTIRLERAEQEVDPGTMAAASYSSHVRLYDEEKDIDGELRLITMNKPLEHRGYMFYQSELKVLGIEDVTGRPVNWSGFTVGYDPGLPLKYAGSIFLGLGIFIMFYMKAYFFKPRKRNVQLTPEVNSPASSA